MKQSDEKTDTKKQQSFNLIDESSEESFPASDPPSWPETKHDLSQVKKKTEREQEPMNFTQAETQETLNIKGTTYHYFSLAKAQLTGLASLMRLPFSLKILLENLLRHYDGSTVTSKEIYALFEWLDKKNAYSEITFRPARVLMQDFTGVPAIVDLAAMRAAFEKLGGKPDKINPLSAVDLVIDHSIQVDQFISKDAFVINAKMEMERNYERYQFLKWGQSAFQNFRVVPPDTGICHQVNLEYLAKVVWVEEKHGKKYIYPDTLVGTDSHTTMINGLGVLGWGVGGIEAEAAMLGQPISMLVPEVIGVKLSGKLAEGVTATDLVLTITNLLRQKGVVGKFVEYFGSGLANLSLPDRATIANMAPEYGATCGFFPVDAATLAYLKLTGRDADLIELVETYCKCQGLWYEETAADAVYTDVVTLDLTTITPCLAGPKRPQDQVSFGKLKNAFIELLIANKKEKEENDSFVTSNQLVLHHGDVVIAAITSCTNTSNPHVLMAAGLVAKKAVEKGLSRKPWVKTSFAPGSQVVTRYLETSGLQLFLDQLGFSLVGYGCTTCIGNSGPLPAPIAEIVQQQDLIVSAVLSGNRNFEGRIHPQVKANWLASPPLVVIFALTGTILIDLEKEPVGRDQQGNPVFLKDLWPTDQEILEEVNKISREMFHMTYRDVFTGKEEWQAMKVVKSEIYNWQPNSTYIQSPPFFTGMEKGLTPILDIQNAYILSIFGDSITTDHISPAGSIKPGSPAGKYLSAQGVAVKDFNSYGSRRGNHEIMMRGTFANIRIRNEMVADVEGGFTKFIPNGEIMSIYDAAMQYQKAKIPLLVIAGKEYGSGSSRDWAAKGPKLLGVRAVIAESFERIHRSNLVGMGILPLQFLSGMNRKTLKFSGSEKIDLLNLQSTLKPHAHIQAVVHHTDGKNTTFELLVRIDTHTEMEYFQHGGILHYMLRNLLVT